MKKAMSLFLTFVMLLSTCVPAFAAPVQDASMMIDDRDEHIVYSSGWTPDNSFNNSNCYQDTRHYGFDVSAQFTFRGTGISMYNEMEGGVTNVLVKLYKGREAVGEPIQTVVADCRGDVGMGHQTGNQKTFTSDPLEYGIYTVTLETDPQDKTDRNSDGFITLDALEVHGVQNGDPYAPEEVTPPPVIDQNNVKIDDCDEHISYSAGWAQGSSWNNSNCYQDTRHYGWNVSAQLTFRGTGVSMYNEMEGGVTNVLVKIYRGLDTSTEPIQTAVADCRGDVAVGNQTGNQKTFTSDVLDYGTYTVTLETDPQDKADRNSDGFITLDALEVHGVKDGNPYLPRYEVSFADGDRVLYTQSVYEGGVPVRPQAPVKDNCQFAGWYADAGFTTEYTFNEPVTGPITVYAKWTADGSALGTAIAQARAIYEAAKVGPGVGEYDETDKEAFGAAIAAAEKVLNSGTATGEDMFQAVTDLETASRTFLYSVHANPNQLDYYVAVNGSDAAAGTQDAPLATVGCALQRMRSARHQIPAQAGKVFTIVLMDGHHVLNETIALDEDDSNLVIKAADGADVTVSAGVSLNQWREEQVNGKTMFVCDAPEGMRYAPRTLYFNGKRAPRASSSPVGGKGVYDKQTRGFLKENGLTVGYVVDRSTLGGDLRNGANIEFVYNQGWRSHRVNIKDITENQDGTCNVYVGAEEMEWNTTMDAPFNCPQADKSFYVENAWGYLDSATEWYYDEAAHKFYYIPAGGEKVENASAYVPNGVENLVSIHGSSPADRVKNVTISGITFSYNTWLRPDEHGACVVQANFYVNEAEQGSHTDGWNETGAVQAEGAIDIACADDIRIDGNTLEHIGSTGIRVSNAAENVEITNNTLKDISESAMVLGCWIQNFINHSGEALVKDVLVGNNYIDRVGVEFNNSPGIAAYYTDSLYIEHNTIKNASYGGINLGWNGWQGTEQDSHTARNTVVRYNWIQDYSMEIGDVGGIYSLGQQNNTEIYDNFFKDAHRYWASLYFDEGSGWITAFRNVTEQTRATIGGTFRWLNCWTSRIHDIFVFDNYNNTEVQNNVGTRVYGPNSENYFIANGSTDWKGEAAEIRDTAGICDNYVPAVRKTAEPGDVAFNTDARFLYEDGRVDFGKTPFGSQYAVDGEYPGNFNPYAETRYFAQGTYAQASDDNAMGVLNVDMLKAHMIDRVKVKFNGENYAAFAVEVSRDGNEFTQVAECAEGSQVVELSFEPAYARYVRIVPKSTNGENPIQIVNVAAFESNTAVPAPAAPHKAEVPQHENVILSVDAADKTVITNGTDLVSGWGKLRTPVAFSADNADRASGVTKRPTLVDQAVNGRPAIVFDGFDDALEVTGLNLSAANGFTVSYYAKPYSSGGLDVHSGETSLAPSGCEPGKWALWTAQCIDGTVRMYLNGSYTGDTWTFKGDTLNTLSLFPNKDIRWKDVRGDYVEQNTPAAFAEITVHNVALTDEEIVGYAAQLAEKYGQKMMIPASIDNLAVPNKVFDGKPAKMFGTPVITDINGNVLNNVHLDYTWSDAKGNKLETAPSEVGSYCLQVKINDDQYVGANQYAFTIMEDYDAEWTKLDDRDEQIHFEGNWTRDVSYNNSQCYMDTRTYNIGGGGVDRNASVTFTFTGNMLRIYNETEKNVTDMRVRIYEGTDTAGALVQEEVVNVRKGAGSQLGNQLTFSSKVLKDGTYTVLITPDEKDVEHDGFVCLDALEYGTMKGDRKPVTGVKLDASSAAMTVGEQRVLKAAVEPADAADAQVIWLSSNPSVVAVDEDGTITAKAEGKAVITAASGSCSAECAVTVAKKGSPDHPSTSTDTDTTVKIPGWKAEEAAKKNETLPLPIAPVKVNDVIKVESKADVTVSVMIPVKDITPGMVAVVVNKDGTKEVIRKTAIGKNGLVVNVTGNTTFQIVDNSKKFDDVKSGSWYKDAVDFVTARELYTGTTSRTFTPGMPMTRGMLAVVLHNMENNPKAAVIKSFSDVAKGQWYYDGIVWATEQGIVAGYPNGTFGPADNISREQLAVMLYNRAGRPTVSNKGLTFADADQVSEYAETAVCWAVQKGIINGVGNNNLDPSGIATRAEVAAMMMNFINYFFG